MSTIDFTDFSYVIYFKSKKLFAKLKLKYKYFCVFSKHDLLNYVWYLTYSVIKHLEAHFTHHFTKSSFHLHILNNTKSILSLSFVLTCLSSKVQMYIVHRKKGLFICFYFLVKLYTLDRMCKFLYDFSETFVDNNNRIKFSLYKRKTGVLC